MKSDCDNEYCLEDSDRRLRIYASDIRFFRINPLSDTGLLPKEKPFIVHVSLSGLVIDKVKIIEFLDSKGCNIMEVSKVEEDGETMYVCEFEDVESLKKALGLSRLIYKGYSLNVSLPYKSGMRKRKEEEKNAGAVVIIAVGNSYEVQNGMPGMKRYILLRLCNMLGDKCKQIREIFAMCLEHYMWKDHSLFRNSKRILDLPASILPNTAVTREHTAHAEWILFPKSATVFLDRCITHGVFRWAVQIDHLSSTGFDIGAVPPQFLRECESDRMGSVLKNYPFIFSSLKNGWRILRKIPNNSVVTIEVDMRAHALSFFLTTAEERVLHAVAGCKAPSLHLGISGDGWRGFRTVSFLRLTVATPHSRLLPSPPPTEDAAIE